MSTADLELNHETLADLVSRLGDIPLNRIRLRPAPGTATPADALATSEREPKRICELVDGVLVEKIMGTRESRFAVRLAQLLLNYLDEHDLGILSGADGPYYTVPAQVRYPDLTYIAYDDIPRNADPKTPLPDWPLTIAVEIISEGNTLREMDRKLLEYFASGSRQVWPEDRTVRVYTSPTESVLLTDSDELTGGDVLPGLRISIRDWFDRADRVRPA